MWARLKDWLSSALPVKLPKSDALLEDITAPMIVYDGVGRLQLEAKADIKKRIGRSTDVGDALALTFAVQHSEFLFKTTGATHGDFVDDNVYL